MKLIYRKTRYLKIVVPWIISVRVCGVSVHIKRKASIDWLPQRPGNGRKRLTPENIDVGAPTLKLISPWKGAY